MKLTVKDELNLFKIGMKGIVVKINDYDTGYYKMLGFVIGTKLEIVDCKQSGILQCSNEQGEVLSFLPSEVLIIHLN